MKFSEFRRYAPPKPHHVFRFVCEDDFLIGESEQVWKQIFGGDWGFEKMSLKEFESLDRSRLMESALSASMFGPSRAILVTGAGKVSKMRTEELKQLSELKHSYLKIVLVSDSARSVDRKNSSFPLVQIDPLRPGDTVRWLQDRFKVSSEVGRYLVENLGTELQVLHGAMEMLAIYLRDARPAEAADVDQLILRSERFGPFELDDAFFGGDYPRVIRVVGAMLEEGVAPILILSRIVRVWRQLFVAKVLDGRAAPGNVARVAGIPQWKGPALVAAARRFRLQSLVEGFSTLVQADRAFKSSSPNPEFFFDVMMWKLMR